MADAKTLTVQKTVFDMGIFDNVLVGKQVTFTPADSLEQALQAVGNDQAKLLKVVNAGLEKELRDQAYASSADWHSFNEEDELNGPFTGTVADPSDVNETVRTLAKTVFGYSPSDAVEDKVIEDNSDPDNPKKTVIPGKKSKKQMARDMVKNTPQIREGLQKKAAAQSSK